ncbi:MAG: c-type cytochrome [Thermoanaerobaculia bacterium]
MKKALKFLGLGVLVLVVAAGAFAAYVAITGIPKYAPGHVQMNVEVTPERVERGRKFAGMLCATCHMDPTTRKLTGKRMADVPPEFGVVYSRNITRDPVKGIGSWTDGELVYLLRTGIHRSGQYVPPYMVKLPHLSDDDLEGIVAFLRSDDPLVAPAAVSPPGSTQPSYLTKFLAHVKFKPLPFPKQRITAPPAGEKVAYGRYLSDALGCYSCHSADFKTMNELEPEKSVGYMAGGNPLRDQGGQIIRSANITFDEDTGIGKWSEADFTQAVRDGLRPDRRVLLYPMEMMPELTEEDTAALYAYLKMVPKLRNAVARAEHKALADASEGKKLYYKYGCSSCHGANGVGLADLRQAAQHYPNDKQLAAWIRNPKLFKPGTKMPTWEGVIPESEYPVLIAYVKELGKTN